MTALHLGNWDQNRGGRAPRRLNLYACLAALLSLVSDGWSGKPSPFAHQLLLLPCLLGLGLLLFALLRDEVERRAGSRAGCGPVSGLGWWGLFEAWSVLLIIAEAHHFRRLGYHLRPAALVESFGAAAAVCGLCLSAKRLPTSWFTAVIFAYGSGAVISILSFPLNYLRSDMLPVIGWADYRLLHHLNPYDTMHVGNRLYDFPYLPGMLLGFLPAAALHLDLRFANLAYVVGLTLLIYRAAALERRRDVVGLIGIFVLCPFLQYRHDLYLEPHWFTLTVAVLLMQRQRFFWAALAWGASCAVYQLSWVVVPFAVLNGWRRGGLREASKVAAGVVVGALMLAGPFLREASRRIAGNTVAQWSRLPHALADPINLSYWLTFVIRPQDLKWVQAAALTALFVYCAGRARCASLADTLRWMCVALSVFIPLNILVDGYFYLTLLLLVLLYVCAAENLWSEGSVRHGVPGRLQSTA